MIKALMVDVDGVIVRGRPSDGRPWSTGLQQDLGIGVEALHAAFFRPYWDEIVVGRARLRDRLATALADVAPHLAVDRLIAYWFARDSRLDEALLAELGALRAAGLQLHLATNQDHERADHLWHVLKLRDHFDGRHYSADLGCRKPDPAFFAAAMQRVDLAPDALLLIDDAAENVAAARAAGWGAVLWTGRESLRDLIAAAGIGMPT